MAKKYKYEVKQETLDSIKEEMKKVLSYYSRKTDKALDDILKEWIRVKQPLLDIFSKHPNWNPDKLMIQFDTDFSRNLDTSVICYFADKICRYARIKHAVDYQHQLPYSENKAIWFLSCIRSQYFDDSMNYQIDTLNRSNDNFKIRNNMKASKAIGKICNVLEWDKMPDYNKEYAKVCDALNPIKVLRHTCISLNPIDFLLMSNGNSWRSCHTINTHGYSAGCYSSGTISYMLDACSFVFYTVDSEFDGIDIELEPKLQRQIFGYKNNVIFQSRLYPQSCDYGAADLYKDIREVIEKVISDCLDIPNLWIKKKECDVLCYVKKGGKSTAYPDFKYQRGIVAVSVHKLQENEKTKLVMMGRQPMCIRCGKKHSVRGSLYCSDCN